MGVRNIAAVIVAGGRSSRMGTPKAFLKIRKVPILDALVETYLICQLDPIVVVLPAEEIHRARHLSAIVVASNPDGPMIESVARGIESLDTDCIGVAIQPVDAPFTAPAVIHALLHGTDRHRVLAHHGHWGHPVFLHRSGFPLVRTRPRGGLRALLEAQGAELVHVEDERILADLDSPEDLQRWGIDKS